MTETIETLEIGAGLEPHPNSTVTLDIREDLEHIDYPGVDIGQDSWPLADESVKSAHGYHVLEHIPPHQIGHVWAELDRVLLPGGTAFFELPHANTWAAATDMTHYGTGGTTPEVSRYFSADSGQENYWPSLNWEVDAWADLSFPNFLRTSLRIRRDVRREFLSFELTKIPFVSGTVKMKIKKCE